GWLLEEIHVTWARLEKKQTRLRLYIKSFEEILIQTVETASPSLVTASKCVRDGVMILKKASESSHLKRIPRSFVEAMASGNLRRPLLGLINSSNSRVSAARFKAITTARVSKLLLLITAARVYSSLVLNVKRIFLGLNAKIGYGDNCLSLI
nr:hypothetical protein [Tanacetum cinerariifolium]